MAFVVAAAENGVIGRDGGLPWHLSSDLKRFRALTMNKPMIMGRKTFESIGKALDGRDTIVVSRNSAFAAEDIFVAESIEAALEIGRERARARSADEIMIVGGAGIYEAAMPFADRLYLTRVHMAPAGDVRFPDPDASVWREVAATRHPKGPRDDAACTDIVLDRVRG